MHTAEKWFNTRMLSKCIVTHRTCWEHESVRQYMHATETSSSQGKTQQTMVCMKSKMEEYMI